MDGPAFEVSAHVAVDEVHAALNRQATQAKAAGDWDQAVHLLREAKARKGEAYDDTRLAKLLQQAGRLDEGLAEIQWLEDHSMAWARGLFAHQPATVMQCQRVKHLIEIEEAAVLMCKRAKRADLMAVHQAKLTTHETLLARLEPIADADEERDRAAWDLARSQGGRAMDAFIAQRNARTARNREG